MKKKLSVIMALVLCLSALFSINVFAADWPSLSSSSYCEFAAAKQINVYKDSACKTRGTSDPAKAYNAYISKNDVCYIYKITSSYAQVNYPTSSGRKTGYIKTKDLLGGNITPSNKNTSSEKVTTYKYNGGGETGYIAKNDTVYSISSSTYNVMYTAKSGKRAWKMAWKGSNPTPNPPSGTTSSKISAFMNDSRWKMGTDWSKRGPYISPYSCSQCMAYAADFAKYVYNANSPKAGTRYTSISDIRVGDTIRVYRTQKGYYHWMVCVGRSGNKVSVIHGNWTGGKACSSTFTISGNMLGDGSRFTEGYHF